MAEQSAAALLEKPSFIKSTVSGMTGFVQGTLTGGIIGAAGGAIIAGILAAFTGGLGAIGGALIGGGVIGALAMGSVGAMAGTMTGVVKSREASQPSAQDVVNVAKVAFSQGVIVGHTMSQNPELVQEENKWRDKVARERSQQPTTPQVH